MFGVFLDRASLDLGDLDFSALNASLPSWQYFEQSTPDAVVEHIAGAEVVITNKVVLERQCLEQSSGLRLICVAATGTNNVDLRVAAERGITVCNVRAYGTASVVQHVFSLITALSNNLLHYHQAVQSGRWQQSEQFCLMDYPIREIAGKVMGIVGYGELGQAVASLAEAFGMEVLVANRPGGKSQPGRLDLNDLLPRVDVLSLHCPLTKDTLGLIGAAELARMKDDALLINTARGGIVDEAALAESLSQGRLGGAGFDVLSVEPPREGNPLLEINLPNLIVTPHMAWASRESRQRLLDQVANNVRAFMAGTPHNVVTA
ncbi:MAG: 2-hydroxyacid dehydrogenase [Gammaproteobacteria bacterium]|nr:2-hydroxyacid dehydrogenase [Gammaproteobacteria bacterium]